MCIVTAIGPAAGPRRGVTVPQLEDDLRATTQDVEAEAAALQEIEEQKAQLPSELVDEATDPKQRGARRRPD